MDWHWGRWAYLVEVVPEAPLARRTEYEVLTRVPDEPCWDGCSELELRVIASFTTGDGFDLSAPTFAGLSAIRVGDQPYECESAACCGPYVVIGATFEWEEGSDESGIVTYRIYRDAPGGTVVHALGSRRGIVHCQDSIGANPEGDFAVSDGTYFVRAVDLAGNEDSNEVGHVIEITCPGDGAPDAGSSGEGDGSGTDGAGSCGCAAGGRPGGTRGLRWLLAALLAAAAITRTARHGDR